MTLDLFQDDLRASSCTVGAVVVPPNPNDVVFTPPDCAKLIVDRFKPTGRILEPCRGRGAFTDLMPGCEWCEIEQGRDFFAWTEPVDWIVSNPPYSVFDAWLDHSFRLADNVVYLIPFAKVFKSMGTINKIRDFGGIAAVIVMNARKAGFPFGFPCGAFHFVRGWRGPMAMEFTDKQAEWPLAQALPWMRYALIDGLHLADEETAEHMDDAIFGIEHAMDRHNNAVRVK